MSQANAKGNIYIVAAPSGGGKTSLVKALIGSMPGIEVSISHTTREMRAKEQHGVDYFFVDEPAFLTMVAENEFIEHACVFQHHYGTAKAQLEARLNAGIDVVLDIDWQGAQQIKALFPDALGLFIIPPSLAILKERLQCRGRDDEQVIQLRMQQAQAELAHYVDFDYLIINDEFEQAASELRAIVLANRLRLGRQSAKNAKLLSFLLN